MKEQQLFPFSLTRPPEDMRVGILTIRQKWEHAFADLLSNTRLSETGGMENPNPLEADTYIVAANLFPTPEIVAAIRDLRAGDVLQSSDGTILAEHTRGTGMENERKGNSILFQGTMVQLVHPWDIARLNAWAITEDWKMLSASTPSQPLSATNWVTGAENIYLEEGVVMEFCHLNATEGPIFIGRGALVMEGSALRGPLAIGERAVIKMGARLYAGTTIGPFCTAGGEIKNSVLFGYSNKAHDGYLGDSVIGEWCNLGAGTTNSNLSNSAGDISVYTPGGFVSAGVKCGVLMGDYSRTAINTSINTGTVIGVSCNVHGEGLTPKYIPSFSWGISGNKKYEFHKALEHIHNWKRLKQKSLEDGEREVLRSIFESDHS